MIDFLDIGCRPTWAKFRGAAGGGVYMREGGPGAELTVDFQPTFNLTPIYVLIAGTGGHYNVKKNARVGGGGGMSALLRMDGTPLIVAGGGGGADSRRAAKVPNSAPVCDAPCNVTATRFSGRLRDTIGGAREWPAYCGGAPFNDCKAACGPV